MEIQFYNFWNHTFKSTPLAVANRYNRVYILCIRISGDKFGLRNDLYFCLCYIVPENSSRQDMMDVHTFDRLLTFITELQVTSFMWWYECPYI